MQIFVFLLQESMGAACKLWIGGRYVQVYSAVFPWWSLTNSPVHTHEAAINYSAPFRVLIVVRSVLVLDFTVIITPNRYQFAPLFFH